MKRNDRAKADKKEEKKESEKNEDGTNPYIAVLNKKLRGLNKKLEKVKGTEAALREGKEINKEQTELLSKKEIMSQLKEEYENIRASLVAIASTEVPSPIKVTVESAAETIKVETKDVQSEAVTSKKDVGTDNRQSNNHVEVSTNLEVVLGSFLLNKFAPERINGHTSLDNCVSFVISSIQGSTLSPESKPNLSDVLESSLVHASKLASASKDFVADRITYASVATRILDLVRMKEPVIVAPIVVAPTVVEPVFDFMVESKLHVSSPSNKPSAASLLPWGDEPSPSIKPITAPVIDNNFTLLPLTDNTASKQPAWGNPLGTTTLVGSNNSGRGGSGGRGQRRSRGDRGNSGTGVGAEVKGEGEGGASNGGGRGGRGGGGRRRGDGGRRSERTEGDVNTGGVRGGRAPRREGGGGRGRNERTERPPSSPKIASIKAVGEK